MKKPGFSEEQVLAILKEQDSRAKVVDIYRKHGITDEMFHNRKTSITE